MSSRDFAEDFNKTSATIGLEAIAKLLTALQKRNPKVEDDATIKWLMYSPLIDLHDTSITLSTGVDIAATRNDDHFARLCLRKYLPSQVETYDLVHTDVGGPMTFDYSKQKLGGDGIVSADFHIKTDHRAYMDMAALAFSKAYWIREPGVGTYGLDNKRDIANTTNAGFEIFITGGDTINIRLADGTNTVLLTASASPINLNDGAHHSIIINIPASGNIEIFVDKVSKGTVARGSVANINNTRDWYLFARDNAGTIQDELDAKVSTWVWKKGEIFSSTQRDQWHDDGVVDLDSASDTEITTFLFDGTTKPRPNATMGMFIAN